MSNLREDPQQLSLFDAAPSAVADELEYTYRVARNGTFVVSGFVAGYGRINVKNRWLAPAVSEFRARAEAARASVQALF